MLWHSHSVSYIPSIDARSSLMPMHGCMGAMQGSMKASESSCIGMQNGGSLTIVAKGMFWNYLSGGPDMLAQSMAAISCGQYLYHCASDSGLTNGQDAEISWPTAWQPWHCLLFCWLNWLNWPNWLCTCPLCLQPRCWAFADSTPPAPVHCSCVLVLFFFDPSPF